MNTKTFTLRQILSITHDHHDHPFTSMAEVYQISNHLTGDQLFTHALLRAWPFCKAEIERQHPVFKSDGFVAQVAAIIAVKEATGFNSPEFNAAVDALCAEYGNSHELASAADTWLSLDPTDEAILIGKKVSDIRNVEQPDQIA